MSAAAGGVGDLPSRCNAKWRHSGPDLLDTTQSHENKRANNVRSCKERPCSRLGFPTPTKFRMTSAKLKPPACTSRRFRMLFLPFRYTRLIHLIPSVLYM